MVLSEEKKREFMKRLLMSRLRILVKNGFYGLLLMHMIFSLDEVTEPAATDGNRIYFNPDFLENLSDRETDFVMMHEILHVVLRHVSRTGNRDPLLFNIAADIVVNSNILKSCDMNPDFITLRKYGEAMHSLPNGKEGYEYSAEEVYEILAKSMPMHRPEQGFGHEGGTGKGARGATVSAAGKRGRGLGSGSSDEAGSFDDHSRWGSVGNTEEQDEVWAKRIKDACESISVRDPSNSRGTLPKFAERMLKELRSSQLDWREILDNFVQEELVDYSFTPPDRRFGDSDFFLPDFNETDEEVKDILFMIDTSGSVSDDMLTAAYSEIQGAIGQFNGKLSGWVGFFDAAVTEPVPFEKADDLKAIRPKGGGGTRFDIIFRYVSEFMTDDPPVSIIILTDGIAPFPDSDMANGIPVLWLLNNDEIDPPWGKIARISI